MGLLNEPITIRLEEGTRSKLHMIAEFYSLDDSELIRTILMGFILSWIDNQMNGEKSDDDRS